MRRVARPFGTELDDDQLSWRGIRGHRDARMRELARDSARYRVCLEAAAPAAQPSAPWSARCSYVSSRRKGRRARWLRGFERERRAG